MSLQLTYVVLLAVLAVFAGGLWQASAGWQQRAEAARRVRRERGEPARRQVRAAVDARLRRTRGGRAVERRLAAAGMGVGPGEAVLGLGACAVVTAVVAGTLFGPLFVPVGATGTVLAAQRYVAYRQADRREQFVGQLPDVAALMSNAAAAGLALPRMIELAAGELRPPACDVLRRVVEELRVGQPIDRALENLHRRMPSREVGVLVSTLVIQLRTGGDSVAALREMATTLDARKDLRREVRTTMAGAVTTSWVVGALALSSLFLLNAMSPGVLVEMARSGLGRIALVVGLGLYACGFLIVRRLTRVET
jgi:tight adherence protein B